MTIDEEYASRGCDRVTNNPFNDESFDARGKHWLPGAGDGRRGLVESDEDFIKRVGMRFILDKSSKHATYLEWLRDQK